MEAVYPASPEPERDEKMKREDILTATASGLAASALGLTLLIILFIALDLHAPSPLSTNPPKPMQNSPYLNTTHYPEFAPYIQNTSIWPVINGTVYQYWVSLDNYQLGVNPCILKMQAVTNGKAGYTLTAAQANATLQGLQIITASGNAPSEAEYSKPVFDYVGGLEICDNYK